MARLSGADYRRNSVAAASMRSDGRVTESFVLLALSIGQTEVEQYQSSAVAGVALALYANRGPQAIDALELWLTDWSWISETFGIERTLGEQLLFELKMMED